MAKLRLNLGSGYDYRQGFVNIDISPELKTDLLHDIRKKLPFNNSSSDYVLASDIFEHLTFPEQKKLFNECRRVLSPTGTLEVRIPNYDDIIERFSERPDVRNYFIFGNSNDESGWMIHKSSHTLESFVAMAIRSGFIPKSIRRIDTNFVIKFKLSAQPKIKKITYINQSLGIGGAEFLNLELFKWLRNNGIKVEIYSSRNDFIDLLSKNNFYAGKIPFVIDLIGDIKGFVKGICLMPFGAFYYAYLTYKVRKSDLIYMTGYIEKVLVTPIAKLFKIPVVWVEYGPLETIFDKFVRIPKFLYRAVSDFADQVIFTSINTLRLNLAITGVSPSRARVIWGAINQKKYNKKNNRQVVCCVSRLEEGKGQDMLIKAWPNVLKEIPHAKLKIVGEGGFQKKLKKISTELKLQKSVEFTGYVADSLAKMSEASVCVFPSLWALEGFGMVMIEAMSLKKPVVAFEAGPAPEVVTNGRTGILVEKGNINALSDALILLLKNPQKARVMGEAGYQKFLSNFTFNKVGPQYIDAFTEAIARTESKKLIKKCLEN